MRTNAFIFVLLARAIHAWRFPGQKFAPIDGVTSWTEAELAALGPSEFGKGVHQSGDIAGRGRDARDKAKTVSNKVALASLTECAKRYEYLREFAQCTGATAIALSTSGAHMPWTYGHVYVQTIYPLFNLLARAGATRNERAAAASLQHTAETHEDKGLQPCERDQRGDGSLALARHNESASPFALQAVDVFLPAGAYLDQTYGQCAFEEAFALFPEVLTGFRLHPAAWVPICDGRGLCVRKGTAPLALRHRLALVMMRDVKAAPISADTFRESAWRAVGLLPSPHAPPPLGGPKAEAFAREELARPRQVTFVSTAHNRISKRGLENEEALVNATRAFFEKHAPELKFVLFDHAKANGGFASEVRTFGRSAVVISLFGSSLHNCRFVPPGAVVIQLHGATKNEWGVNTDRDYYELCARRCGARWAPYRVPGSIPLGVRVPGRADGGAMMKANRKVIYYDTTLGGPSPENVARVNVSDLTERFLPKVLRGEWEVLLREFANSRRAQTEPQRAAVLPPLPKHWVPKGGLPAQYTQTSLLLIK